MPAPAPDLLRLLPEDRVGVVERLEPITLGLSGAGVYAVTTSRGAYVLRVQGRQIDEGAFAQQLRILRRAAEAGVAPALAHVDEAALAVVSVRVPGVPMAAALADPAQRGPVFASVVDRLRTLHALDRSGIAERDPLSHTRAAWAATRDRPGVPPWAASLAPTLEAIVATLALFLRLEDDVALDLVSRHDGAPLDDRSRASFRALRQLVGLLCGLMFLSMVDDLGVRPAPILADAPSLLECYQAMRAGQLDMQSARGRASMGLALLAEGVRPLIP